MKEIRIITRHFISNYGSVLQSVATQKFFESICDDVKIIDYIPKRESSLRLAKYIAAKKYKSKLKRLLFILLRAPDYFMSSRKFGKYRKRLLRLTRRYKTAEKLKEESDSAVLCAGSDQLFGLMPYGDIDKAYYLDFAHPEQKKIAFSSSFGRLDPFMDRKEEIKTLLGQFDAVSMREASGVEFLQALDVPAMQILDPTLMVPRSFWHEFCDSVRVKEKAYLLIYNLHTNQLLEDIAAKIAAEKNLQIIRVSQFYSAMRLKGKKKCLVSPETFAAYVKYAAYVVTDSFHGTVFSTIFGCPFTAVNPGVTSGRITDFLNGIGLDERFASCAENEVITTDIDFSGIHELLDSLRLNKTDEFAKMIASAEKTE